MLLDTSGLLIYFDANSDQHAAADKLFKSSRYRLTHSYVLAEFIPLGEVRGYFRQSVLTFSRELMHNPLVEIVWVDEALHQAAFALLEARLDKTYSLCDAVSFVLMRQRGLLDALTTDHHFAQEGFIKLL
ncbi:MAG: type II toxin-antitoxin system VapC family toxin [Acidobacteria bacterium]|nr:type II toxin-antitoxin system VapC family toxin [Acidobacteriota bacterium]MBI3425406.1 type II toxin-antitoxin system VapC family toxin [Acidobacteriota bacterium]